MAACALMTLANAAIYTRIHYAPGPPNKLGKMYT
jgi:hypothetical protein